MMNELARQQLFALIDEYSPSILDDTRRCENLLQDVCSAYLRELTVLTNALRERIPVELATDQSAASIAAMAHRLEENYATTPDAARWAVETWAQALGILPRPLCEETALEVPTVPVQSTNLQPTVISARPIQATASEQPTVFGGEQATVVFSRRPWTAVAIVAFFVVAIGGLTYLGRSANPSPPDITTTGSNRPPIATDSDKPPTDTTDSDTPTAVSTTSLSDDPAANGLTEPGAFIDGIWNMYFSNGSDSYKAVLAMKGSTGVLQVTHTSKAGDTEVVTEDVRLWGSSQGLVAAGAKPIDPTTKAPKANYTPDNFIFVPQGDSSYKPTKNCDKSSGEYRCFPVEGEFYGNLTN